jgi:hypothetical protein
MGPLFASIVRVLAMLGLTNFQAKWNAYVAYVNGVLASNSVDGAPTRRYTAFDSTTGLGTSTLLANHVIQGRSKSGDFTQALANYEVVRNVNAGTSSSYGVAIALQTDVTPGTAPETAYGLSSVGGFLQRPTLTSLGVPTGIESRANCGVFQLGLYLEGAHTIGDAVVSFFNTSTNPWIAGGASFVTGISISYDSAGGPTSLGLTHHIKGHKVNHGLRTGVQCNPLTITATLLSQLAFGAAPENKFLILVDGPDDFYLIPESANSTAVTIGTFTTFTTSIRARQGVSGLDGWGNLASSVASWATVITSHPMVASGALKFDGRGAAATTETPNFLLTIGSDGPAGRGRHDWDGYGYRRLGDGANATAIALGATNPIHAIVLPYDATSLTSHYIRAYRTIRISSTAALTGWTGNVLPPSYDGHEVTLYNAGSFSIVLPHGTGYNLRLIGGANQTLAALASVRLMFDATVGNWIQIGAVVTPV